MRNASVAIVVVLILLTVGAPAEAKSGRWWVGGGIGLSFGDVNYIEVEPLIGYNVTKNLSVGGGVLYRYRKDERFEPNLSTNDYGLNAFVRYQITRPLFVQGEFEFLSYEYINFDTTDRDNFNSFLLGPGFRQSMGNNASLFVTALYNFSYESGDLITPYDDPWRIRVGVAFGF